MIASPETNGMMPDIQGDGPGLLAVMYDTSRQGRILGKVLMPLTNSGDIATEMVTGARIAVATEDTTIYTALAGEIGHATVIAPRTV